MIFIKSGKRKIIFCTRIAETAITIDGVTAVIDVGYDREQVYDQKKKMTVSMMRDITQSAAKQRAGRAGRTRAGVCFRLYSEEKFEGMHPFKQAEILRMNLDNVVLKIKMFNVKNLLQFPFLEKPD